MNASTTHMIGRVQRFFQFPFVRIVVALFSTALAGGLSITYLQKLANTLGGNALWPPVIAALIVLATYGLYVQVVERRAVEEISARLAGVELAAGLLLGSALVVSAVALIAVLGSYRVSGVNEWSMAILVPLAMMTFVGVLEEVISRAIVFRITEQSWGSWAALALSSLLFGLAHMPGVGASMLAITITVVAGVMFAAAYMLTRRLWLAICIHVSWNYTLGSIFSVAVSGREAKGLLVGDIVGPDVVTGGAYGFEGSIVTLLLLATFSAFLLRAAWVRGRFQPRLRHTGSTRGMLR